MSPHSPWYLISLGHLTVIFFLLVPYYLDFADITFLVPLIQTLLGLFSRLDPSSSASSWYTDVMVHSQVLCSSLSLWEISFMPTSPLTTYSWWVKKSLTQRLCIIKVHWTLQIQYHQNCVSQILLFIWNSELLLS